MGSNPTLSLAEVYGQFGLRADYKLIDKDCLLVDFDNIDPKILINKLGGTVKIGKVVSAVEGADLLPAVYEACQPQIGKKFFFGFSTFGKAGQTKALAMNLKKQLQSDGINSRWVVSREKNLSSAAVEQSGLMTHGQEIVLIKDGKKTLVGITEAIQPFKDWSFRDYGRPGRDDLSGMLPPKLARIMLNLGKPLPDEAVLDPFCGSGTVLNEAALLGCSKIIGSDLSLDALEDSKTNLSWLKDKYQDLDFRCQLFHSDARRLDEILEQGSIDKIITEPYLGPSRGANNQQKIIRELTGLYNEFLATAHKILKSGGRMVMVWPIFLNGSRKNFLDLNIGGWTIHRPLPTNLEGGNIKLTQRQTIIYGREGQKVWREIVILVKK